ncbi:MAG TPA: MFS transporter [Kofleriaceae bacterium]|jgi:predicted MFS family arabinose efflux permease
MTRRAHRAAAILACLTIANVVAYAGRNGLVSVYDDLRRIFGLPDDQIGLLATAFIVPHALATLPFGWAGDRWDRRRVIAVGVIVASIGGAMAAISSDRWVLFASRAVLGLGMAAVVPVANSIIGQLYEGPHKASRMAIFNLGLLVGAVVGLGTGTAVGFPLVVVILAVPGLAIALVIWKLDVPAHPGHGDPSTSFSQLSASFFTTARALLRISTLRWVILSATAMAFAAGGYSWWLVDFLMRDKGMSKASASELLSVGFIGAVAGIVTGARLADRLRRRRPTGRLWVIVIGMVLALPVTAAAIELPAGATLYAAGFGTLFFMSWYHAPIAVSVDDLAPPSQSAAAQGLVICMMHLLGTAPSAWILGIVSRRWSLYSAMWVPMATIVIAALAMIAATRTFARDAAKARAGGTPGQASL